MRHLHAPKGARLSLAAASEGSKRRRVPVTQGPRLTAGRHPDGGPYRGHQHGDKEVSGHRVNDVPRLHIAEREGFEPPVRQAYSGFQDRHIRPLCHLSRALLGPTLQQQTEVTLSLRPRSSAFHARRRAVAFQRPSPPAQLMPGRPRPAVGRLDRSRRPNQPHHGQASPTTQASQARRRTESTEAKETTLFGHFVPIGPVKAMLSQGDAHGRPDRQARDEGGLEGVVDVGVPIPGPG